MKKYCICCGATVLDDNSCDHDKECIWFEETPSDGPVLDSTDN